MYLHRINSFSVQIPTSEKFSAWCFTLNNPTEDEFLQLRREGDGVRFIVWQEEKGEQGTRHVQGYVELEERRRLGYLRRRLSDRAHFEPRRGTQEEAIAYCRKEDTRLEGGSSFTWGQPKLERRTRRRPGTGIFGGSGTIGRSTSDSSEESPQTLRAVRRRAAEEALKEYRSLRIRLSAIPEETLLYPGFMHAAQMVSKECLGPYRPNLRIVTVKGPTGCGKSYAAYRTYSQELQSVQCANNGIWFGGQERGKVLLIDEFVGQIPINFLLQILDPYPFRLPTKGGFTPAFYELVIITTNLEPSKWYAAKPGPYSSDQEIEKRQGNLDCLYRRLGWSYDPLERSTDYIEVPDIAIPSLQGQRQWLEYRWNDLELPKYDHDDSEDEDEGDDN